MSKLIDLINVRAPVCVRACVSCACGSLLSLRARAQRNERKFGVKPVGPIGAALGIKPEHKKWLKAAEECIGFRIKNFLGASCSLRRCVPVCLYFD